MKGLYAIVDVDALAARGLDPVRFARALLRARPAALQLRDKRRGAAATLETLRALSAPCRDADVPLFANDRADLAQLAGATGVHLGQEDLPPELARAVDPGLRVGLSTHDDAELDAALGEPPGYVDYVAIGPIFETRSKDRPSPIVGVAALAVRAARVRAARPALPIVAIGGVDAERIAALAPLVDAVAIIGALLPRASDADPYDAAAAQALDLAGRIAAAQAGARA